jgi:hypothetical protein
MRKPTIIIAGGLTLLVLAGVGFWFLLPRSELGRKPARLNLPGEVAVQGAKEEEQRQAKAAAEAEAKSKAAEAEQQRLKEEVQRQAKAAPEAESKRRAAEAEQQRLATLRPNPGVQPASPGTGTFLAPPASPADSERKAQAPANDRATPPVPASPASERKAQATAGDNETRKLQQARQTLERLPKGKIVLDAPKAMSVGDTRAVYANVGINVPIELLRKHSRPTDQSHEAVVSVSSEMAATLTGPGFAITPTTPEQQGVAEGFPTVWSWNVEAKQEGEQELEATLYVLLPTRQRIDSYTDKIGVSVKALSWGEWLKSSKEEVEAVHVIAITLGSAIMAVLGWLGLSYSRRRQTENRNQTEAT